MSTPFFALYPNDFLADVGHLGNTELGIYWRLLLVYYRDGRPLPFDNDKLRRIGMTFSPEECRALDAVMTEFFTLSAEPDGTRVWRHKRADVEVARAANAHEKRSAAARLTNSKRWGRGSLEERVAKRSASDVAQRPTSDGEPEPEPEPEKSSTSKTARGAAPPPPKPAKPKASELKLLTDAGVSEVVAQDWLFLRKAKRLPLTGTAMEGIEREAALAGLTTAEAIREAVERGWGSFKAAWLQRELAAIKHPVPQHTVGKAGMATLHASANLKDKLFGGDDET